MTHKRILPYKMGSQSSKLLSQELGILQVHPEENRSRYKADRTFYSRRAGRTLTRRPTTIINWGRGNVPDHLANNVNWINKPENVSLSIDKRRTLQTLHDSDVPVPEFTFSRDVVREWLDDGKTVFVRKLVNAHSARGLEVLNPEEDNIIIPQAPLYTKYIKKRHEYRVHIFKMGTEYKLYINQKRKSRNVEEENTDYKIRNYQTGWIFAQELSFKPDDLEQISKDALDALNLDFACFDIVYNERENKCYIIEANTACGIQAPSTLRFYLNSFRELLNI